MKLNNNNLRSGFSLVELLMAILILGLAASGAYQAFYSIEKIQYQALRATQDIDQPVAAFNQFFAQYNRDAENSIAVEVLDFTPGIDNFDNDNRFRSDRIRVLFDPDETMLGLDSDPGNLTEGLTADYTFSDGILTEGFGGGTSLTDPNDFIHQDFIASAIVTLPTEASLGTFDPANPTQTKHLFHQGGYQRGTWIGIAFMNGDYYLRFRAGRGTVSESDNFSAQDRAIASVSLDSLSQYFDGEDHNITWDVDTGDEATDSPGRIRLWIDNVKVIDAQSTCDLTDPARYCHLGLPSELPSWAGGNAGAWGTGIDCNIPGGHTVYSGQQFQNCNPWPTPAGTLSVFRNQLIDESAVPDTDEPQIILPLTDLAIDNNQAIYYRVFAVPRETCKFTGGTSLQYTFDCFDDDDYDLLKEDIDTLLNEDGVPFFDVGMFNGALCRVTGYDPTTEILTLSANSNCPSSSADTDVTASPTVYFIPPRLVFYSSDFSLNYVQSVMESFADPINRFGDDLATREPTSF